LKSPTISGIAVIFTVPRGDAADGAASAFPRRAVAGDWSRLRPTKNSTTETR